MKCYVFFGDNVFKNEFCGGVDFYCFVDNSCKVGEFDSFCISDDIV